MTGRNPIRKEARAGFTLLEVLVAASLAVLLSALVLGLATALLRQWREGTERVRRELEIAKAYELLQDDLEAAVVTPDSRPWFRASQFSDGETTWRWLRTTPSGKGLALIEWALVRRDERGRPSLDGWTLCRVEVPPGEWSALYGERGAVGAARPMADFSSAEDWWSAAVLASVRVWEVRLRTPDAEDGTRSLFLARSEAPVEPRDCTLPRARTPGSGRGTPSLEWSFAFGREDIRARSDDPGLAADASAVFFKDPGILETWRFKLPDPR